MATWMNSDGLFIRYGTDESDQPRGAHRKVPGTGEHVLEMNIAYTDMASATPALLGAASATTDGSATVLPKGAKVTGVETIVTTAFTSSGTIGSSTFVLGTKKSSDRTTELDHDGILAAGATGTVLGLATVGTTVRTGATGRGAHFETALSEEGLIVASNSAHASHPYTAGAARVRVFYRFD